MPLKLRKRVSLRTFDGHPWRESTSGAKTGRNAGRTCVVLWIFLASAWLCSATVGDEPAAEALSPEDIEFFESKIRPVLVEHCYACHSAQAKEVQGGLLLDTREAIRTGGDSGPAIVPGNVDESLMLAAIRYESLEMPPAGKLAPELIADFETWIRRGAADPRVATSAAVNDRGIDIEAGRQFWAFQPPQKHGIPSVQHTSWPQKRIDYFLLAAMNAAQLEPNPPADPRTLIRRLSFDLTGLPPAAADIDAFVQNESPDALARFVDKLLASPHYGERMARMWLDVARFAEDQAHIVGDDRSLCYPNAYLYRDWVIQAFNRDLPYDQFIRWQLAADVLEPEKHSLHVALGFLGLGPKYYDRKRTAVQADEWEDRVDTVARGLLGLTVACARCHDHKFDPIPIEDYYGLAGVFASTEMYNRPIDEQRELNEKGQAKEPKDAVHIVREGEPQDLSVFIRGNVDNQGPLVPRHFLQVLSPGESMLLATGSGRQDLADAIANSNNPLTARVIVNRVWALHFGQPLVATPSNFGTTGARPSHPALLDDLAVRFIENDWSLKWLQRELVLSAAYQQSSRAELAKIAVDPENRWLSRMPRRRLSVEAWRDTLLMVSGELDQSVGGPSVNPLDTAARRRTVYSVISRLELNQLLALFDFPDPNLHAERRNETTTPLQKLFIMNSPFMVHYADSLATRLLTSPICEGSKTADAHDDPSDQHQRIELAYRWIFGRPPTDEETEMAMEYLNLSPTNDDSARLARWRQYVHVLLASNELLFLD